MRALLVLALLGLTASLSAQHAEVRPARRVGEYAGVRPGGEGTPPRGRSSRSGSEIVTWPGFMPEGGGRFFLQTTGPIQTEAVTSDGRLEIVLKGATTHRRNTRRWIDTRFFNTPVRRARIVRRGRGRNRELVMVFEMRAQVRPTITTSPGEGGYQYIFIDFPDGDYIPQELRREPVAQPEPEPEPAPPQNAPRGDTSDIDIEALENERPPGQ
ncbi:MAG: hypothetical protein AAF645_09495 [Myxococcota bacterium]